MKLKIQKKTHLKVLDIKVLSPDSSTALWTVLCRFERCCLKAQPRAIYPEGVQLVSHGAIVCTECEAVTVPVFSHELTEDRGI